MKRDRATFRVMDIASLHGVHYAAFVTLVAILTLGTATALQAMSL